MTLTDVLQDSISSREFYENVARRNAPQHEQLLKIAAYVKESQPGLAQSVVKDANLAMNGMLTLPGTGGEPYFVGKPPLWHDNPVKTH